MPNVDSSIALQRWNKIVKETQPIFNDIESGNFSNQDLSRLSQVLRKQSKLASSVFEQNLKLLNSQAQQYIPEIKKSLTSLGRDVSSENIGKVVEEIFKGLIRDNLPSITDKVKEAVTKEAVTSLQKAAKDVYEDYMRFYGKSAPIKSPKDGDFASVVDPNSNVSLLEKIYNSVINMGQALVDLPNTIVDKVSVGVQSNIADLIPNKEAPTVANDFLLKDTAIPIPEKLEEKLTDTPVQEILPEAPKEQTIKSVISDTATQTSESFSSNDNNMVSNVINAVGAEGRETRKEISNEIMGQSSVILEAVKENKDNEKNKDDEETEGDKEVAERKEKNERESVFSRIGNIVGLKYLMAIKDAASGFYDNVAGVVDKARNAYDKGIDIGAFLIKGGLAIWALSHIIRHVKWAELGSDIVKGLIPDWMRELWDRDWEAYMQETVDRLTPDWMKEAMKKGWGNTIKEAVYDALYELLPDWMKKGNREKDDNNPSQTNREGKKAGHGTNAKGDTVYSTQNSDGTYTAITTKADGSREVVKTDIDSRVMPSGPYKGWVVKQQGDLSEVGYNDMDGTYTDYMHPTSGKVIREFKTDSGYTPKPQVISERDEKGLRALRGKVISSIPAPNTTNSSAVKVDPQIPPDFQKKATAVPQSPATPAQDNARGTQARPSAVKRQTSAVSVPEDFGKAKTVTVPDSNRNTATTNTKSPKSPPQVGMVDAINLQTTAPNGNRGDDTLGLLNGRDF